MSKCHFVIRFVDHNSHYMGELIGLILLVQAFCAKKKKMGATSNYLQQKVFQTMANIMLTLGGTMTVFRKTNRSARKSIITYARKYAFAHEDANVNKEKETRFTPRRSVGLASNLDGDIFPEYVFKFHTC